MTTLPRATRTARRAPAILASLALLMVLPGAASADLVQFTSPLENIDCIAQTSGDSIGVSCLAEKTNWPVYPRRPAGCGEDWATTDIGLSRHKVRLGACRGDVGPLCFDDCRVLKYRQSIDVGAIRCTSRTNGITCRYRSGVRAGFRIAYGGYAIWRR